MAKNKTTETEKSVQEFIETVKDETKRKDCRDLVALMEQETKEEAKMWGPSIVGFGSYHYKYESGREGDAPVVAFSPRASTIALYLSGSFEDREILLAAFGKHKTDKGCIHIKTLGDVDQKILKKMVGNHVKHIKKQYGGK
jgi:nucleoid DNA-binding protein